MATPTTIRAEFPGYTGEMLSARLEMPDGEIRAYAIFAHCFTCSKESLAAKRTAYHLASLGIATLRFDFTGLGGSKGEFAESNFSTNVIDLLHACEFMRENYEAPSLLIGHSLGGAAVLATAGEVPELKAVATIGAPSDTKHLLYFFDGKLEKIDAEGEADVTLVGRHFTFKKQFIDDLRSTDLVTRIAKIKKPLIVLHSPTDKTVGIENAAEIFQAAKHPKSYISLDGAEHLLTDDRDSDYAALMIASFAERYIKAPTKEKQPAPIEGVMVNETEGGKFQQLARAGKHELLADEPVSYGGLDSGPSPYDFLAIALGSCTSMTLRMYLARKSIELGTISVKVDHDKIHIDDCKSCSDEQADNSGHIDRFTRIISVDGEVPAELYDKLLEIADKCPVHKTMERSATIETKIIR